MLDTTKWKQKKTKIEGPGAYSEKGSKKQSLEVKEKNSFA